MTAPAARRGRGERAGLDRAAIIDAAREIDPAALTMQSVADRLGVDRKALHHHVSGRDALLELLAEDVFLAHMSRTPIPADADWRDACRRFAEGMRAALLASGALAEHFRTSSQVTIAAVRPAEIVIERLLSAGFDDETAGRIILLLTTIATGFAREQFAAAGAGGHPQVTHFREMLSEARVDELGVLRRLDSSGFDAYGEAQFAFDVDAVVTAMSARLPAAPSAAPSLAD
ncbi:TetR/AcrR family transcriptional regulator C-terminal domain-containing protein [Microbacterium sp. NPDC089189]|uniref:TetR/AcrR family transcriptional regulator C-terminal domain-containing protein n=1 Tax=Microbacterium sp. NPDC089189 TaxID=3154972 RepID=UPI00341BD8A5